MLKLNNKVLIKYIKGDFGTFGVFKLCFCYDNMHLIFARLLYFKW